MLSKVKYPQCSNTFKKLMIKQEVKPLLSYLEDIKIFDVTLRDGLQGLSKYDQQEYVLEKKINLYHKILFNYNPKNIEIGSIVSPKVLPIFKDSLELFEVIQNHQDKIHAIDIENKQNIFLLIPNQDKLKTVINNPNISNFSFITSVSNQFQIKNTKMNLEESDKDICNMLYELDENKYRLYKPYIKLYVSCINECPIIGKIDNDFIINRLLKLNKMNIDNICLSDTCGSLTEEDFEYIVDTCHYFGLDFNKFGIHLHVKKGKEDEVEKIIHKALDRKIINFDVSELDTGGCSVTMNKNQLVSNLSYELYYKSLSSYINKKLL